MNSLYSLPVNAILLLGPTGSGKSPLGDYLSSHGLLGHKCHHFDFGSELRSLSTCTHSDLFSSDELHFIQSVLRQGLLLENDRFPLAKKILIHALDRFHFDNNHILILNGMPRHSGQANDLSSLAKIISCVVLDCSCDSVFFRLRDNVGGDRSDRIDDEKMLVEKKLRIFNERTEPLIQFYKNIGSSVYHVSIDPQTKTTDAYRQLLSLATADPPVSFVTKPPQR